MAAQARLNQEIYPPSTVIDGSLQIFPFKALSLLQFQREREKKEE